MGAGNTNSGNAPLGVMGIGFVLFYILLSEPVWSSYWGHRTRYQPLNTHTDPGGQHPKPTWCCPLAGILAESLSGQPIVTLGQLLQVIWYMVKSGNPMTVSIVTHPSHNTSPFQVIWCRSAVDTMDEFRWCGRGTRKINSLAKVLIPIIMSCCPPLE